MSPAHIARTTVPSGAPAAAAALVAELGLGRLEQELPLRGEAAPNHAERGRWWLCLTSRGLWVVSASKTQHRAHSVLDDPTARYERGRLSDRLVVAGQSLGIPAGRGDQVREWIALGRLRSSPGAARSQLPRGPWCDADSELEQTAVAVAVDPEELVLACLRSASRVPLPSRWQDGADAAQVFVVTERRALLLRIGCFGDHATREVDASSLRVAAGRVSAASPTGALEWRAARNAAAYTELGRALQAQGAARTLEVARLCWMRRSAPDALGMSRALIARLGQRGDPLAIAAGFLVAAELGEALATRPDIAAALALLAESSEPKAVLAGLWRSWECSLDAGRALLDRLRSEPALAEHALELHLALRNALVAQLASPIEGALVDLELAEHALERGRHRQAHALAATRMEAAGWRPSEVLAAGSLSVAHAPDTAAELAVRVRLAEVRAAAAAHGDERDVPALAELARLQPLLRERLDALAAAAAEPLAERARRTEACLRAGGLRSARVGSADPTLPVASQVSPIASELLDAVGRYPTEDRAFVTAALQALIATPALPERAHLYRYCDRVVPGASSQGAVRGLGLARAQVALTEASVALGVPEVECFVPRGSAAIGIRAYDASPPLLLLGGRHLDPDDARGLDLDELRFAIGTEVTHLRFGHTRLTANEVLEGALATGRQGLVLLLGVRPSLRGWRAASRVGRLVSKVPTGTLERALASARTLEEALRKLAPETARLTGPSLSPENEKLTRAHRVMQRTADRLGLVLAGDLRAAFRAMLAVRPSYDDVLAAATTRDLPSTLAAGIDAGDGAVVDLTARMAALASFYLSDDYPRLRAALLPVERRG